MTDDSFEGYGSFSGDPLARFTAHQAAKGNLRSQVAARRAHDRQLLERKLELALAQCVEAKAAVDRAIDEIKRWQA